MPIRCGYHAAGPSLKLVQRARTRHTGLPLPTAASDGHTDDHVRAAADSGHRPGTAAAALERFGSLAGVRTATPAEIAAVPGFSTRLADRILDRLHQRA
jgi:ERCC4-type nuclease